MQREYGVSYQVTWTTYVVAKSPKEAADLAEHECPHDINSAAFVWRNSEKDPGVVIEWDESYGELPDYDDAEEREEE